MTSVQPPVEHESTLKIVVIGDPNVGKTSLIRRYVRNVFVENTKTTPGCEFLLKVIEWPDGSRLRTYFWDIAGQERGARSMRMYFRATAGAFIVYDVTNKESFGQLAEWKRILDSNVVDQNNQTIPCVLLANKCDLESPSLAKNSPEMAALCERLGFRDWFPTSAKDNEMVHEAVTALIQMVIDNNKLCEQPPLQHSLVDLKSSTNCLLKKKKSYTCCPL